MWNIIWDCFIERSFLGGPWSVLPWNFHYFCLRKDLYNMQGFSMQLWNLWVVNLPTNLFVTSKNETKNSLIHQFKVLQHVFKMKRLGLEFFIVYKFICYCLRVHFTDLSKDSINVNTCLPDNSLTNCPWNWATDYLLN